VNPFLDQFLKSQAARTLLAGARDPFDGGRWIPTPGTDAKLGKPTKLADWWQRAYDTLIASIGEVDYDRPTAASAAADFTHFISGVTRAGAKTLPADATAAIDALKTLAEALPPLASLSAKAAGPFRDATFSAIAATAVIQESAVSEVPISDLYPQVRLRDVSGDLYELAGDLPEGLRFGAGDSPQRYLHYAAQGIDTTVALRPAPPNRRPNSRDLFFDRFLGPVDGYMSARDTLRDGTGSSGEPLTKSERTTLTARRDKAMTDMATIQERLAQAATQRAIAGDKSAGDYVVMSAIFAETMRGVLGLDAREPGAHQGAIPKDLLEERSSFGEGRAEAIENEEEGREPPS
jgi:hypothetical protein